MVNSGFDYDTVIEKCDLNYRYLRSEKHSLYPSSNHMNHTHFYTNMVEDRFWWDLSDDTKVGVPTWKDLKVTAMADDYESQDWFVSNLRLLMTLKLVAAQRGRKSAA